jgi:hypothetical protein
LSKNKAKERKKNLKLSSNTKKKKQTRENPGLLLRNQKIIKNNITWIDMEL